METIFASIDAGHQDAVLLAASLLIIAVSAADAVRRRLS